MRTRRNKTIKIKNNTLAIAAAPEAIPVNPNIAATMAIIKNVADHFNITLVFLIQLKLYATNEISRLKF